MGSDIAISRSFYNEIGVYDITKSNRKINTIFQHQIFLISFYIIFHFMGILGLQVISATRAINKIIFERLDTESSRGLNSLRNEQEKSCNEEYLSYDHAIPKV